MLWHRQAIFKSKRRQVVFLCRMQDWNPVPDTKSPADWMLQNRGSKETSCVPLHPGSQTPNRQDWMSLTNRLSIEDQAKNLNSTARPYDQRAFSPLDPTVSWLSHLAQAIYIFVVVNFDALAQASDIQIERRQVVFLCRMQDWNPGPRHQIASRLNARWQTDWAIEDQAKNLNATARPYDQGAFSPLDPTVSWLSHLAMLWRYTYLMLLILMRAFSPLDPTVSWLSHLALAIYIFVVVNFDALAQASDIQIKRRQVVFLCRMQDWNPGSQTLNRQQTGCSLTNRLSYRGSS